MTLLRNFYSNDFEPLRLRGRAFDTKRLYRTTLNNFDLFLGRAALLSDLTDETANRFLSWFLAKGRGRSPYSANKERSNLLAIWRFACRRRDPGGNVLVREWPNVDPEVEPEDDPVAWLDYQLTDLFMAMTTVGGSIGNVPAALWWFALHCVLWDTGERITATLRITWENVDLHNGFITVPAATRKGGRKGKTYKMHPQTVEAVKAIILPSREELFPWPYSRTYVWNRYKKILTSAGLPHDRKSKFHRMRRSFASHAEAAGLNATELLDHSSRKVTKRYLDPRIVGQKQGADVLFRPTG